MRVKWRANARWAVFGAVSCAVALSVAASPAGAAAGGGPAPGQNITAGPGGPARTLAASAAAAQGPSQTVTLVTGDVVRLTGKPGHQSAQVIKNVEPAGGLSTLVMGKQKDVYVIPGAAVPMIAAGQLDEHLFDVSELARDGYTGSTLPVLVTYKSDTQALQAQQRHQLAQATVSRHLWSIRGLAARVNLQKGQGFFNSVTAPATPAANGRSGEARTAGPLTIKPGVAKVWLDAKVHATLDVSRTAIGADKAWAAGYQGATAKVAILDTGIDQTHPDLAGQVAAGQNFVPAGNPGGGVPTDVTDRFGHGTHVAGIIAGTGAASGGQYAGVAPKAQLVIGKVLDNQGAGDDSWIIAGMQWAATQAKVINISLGGGVSDGSDPLSEALNSISRSTGALFVVAAGNDGIDPGQGGGPGSCAQCIESPGAADLALTVGAIDSGCNFPYGDPNQCPGRTYSGNDIHWFSSTGPRLNDFAIKPEITAPGVDMPSARAAGTNLGTPVTGHESQYTYLSGTSMATPVVAGAAAVLLGQHPDWTEQQIRDALASTATANTSEPVYWQGSGMVNVGRAATQNVFGTGTLNLGTAAYPQQPGTTLAGDITYTNTGSQPETLTLRSSFSTAPDDFSKRVSSTPWSPPAGAVSLPSQVTVPANGSQTVKLSVDATQAPYFSTFGTVTATAADGTTVQTSAGFTRTALTHQLRLTAIDRTGAPVTTVQSSYGALMDLTTGHVYLVTFTNGAGTIWGTRNNQLIAGRSYAFMGQIGSFGPAPYYHLLSWTQMAEPQITLNQDQSFTFDARTAGRIDVRTQQPTADLGGCSLLSRQIPGSNGPLASLSLETCGNAAGDVGANFYTLQGGQATTGTFQHVFLAHREDPPVTIRAAGSDTEFRPHYPAVVSGPYGIIDNLATDSQPRFPASARIQVADVGTGTAAEIAGAHVAGKLALLRPPASTPTVGGWWNGVYMQIDGATAKAIADAGATGILVAPPADGIGNIFYNKPDLPPIPTALLFYPEATQLTGLLAAGHSRVRVASAWPSPYAYDLVLTQQGQGLTNGVVFNVDDRDLARETVAYHSAAQGEYYLVFAGYPSIGGLSGYYTYEDIPVPTVRTEMFTPGAGFFQSRAPEIRNWQPLSESLQQPLARGRYQVNVGSGPWVPGPYQDYQGNHGMVVSEFSYLYPSVGIRGSAGNLTDVEGYPANNSTSIICDPPACQQTPNGDKLSGDGVYKVVNDAQSTNALSVRSHTEWTVNVHLDQKSARLVPQPAILATWYVHGGLDNVVPAGKAYAVSVVPSYPASTGNYGPVTARLWATYDDGQTWVQVPGTRVVQAGQAATFSLWTPGQTNGFVGYRVQMTDASGNAIDQTVIRAAFTHAP